MVANAEELFKMVGMSDSDVRQCLEGNKVVRGTIDGASTTEREIACYVASLLKAPADALMADVFMTSSKKMEADPSVSAIGTITAGGTIADFAGVTFGTSAATMVKKYLNAAAGSDLNLSKEEIARFQELKHKSKNPSSVEVEVLFRQILAERCQAYMAKGTAGVAPYRRAGNKDFAAGDEMKQMAESAAVLKKVAPEFYQYWVHYPDHRPAGLVESFSWQVSNPEGTSLTVALVHKMGLLRDNGMYVFAQRHFYVSGGHNSVNGVGGAFPVGGDGATAKTALIYGARTSTDRVSGFGGSAKRLMGSKVMGGKIADNMERLRQSIA